MKLLFDQNLSHRLVDASADLFPGSMHVRVIGLDKSDDDAIWNFAKRSQFTIVSKNTYFRERSFLFGHPPKVIWVAVSDCSISEMIDLLRARHAEILDFEADPTASYMALF